MRSKETSRWSFEIGEHDTVEVSGGGYDHGHPGTLDVSVSGGELRFSLERRPPRSCKRA